MIDNDFTEFWNIGHAVLAGKNPYSVKNYYPPATSMLFMFFALLPENWSFIIWVILNVFILARILFKRNSWVSSLAWFTYTPVLFIFVSGQLDIAALWLSSFLDSIGWPAIVAASFLTLKPQLAFIVLPWVLMRWMINDRRKIVGWLGVTFLIHSLPLIFWPGIYSDWISSASSKLNDFMMHSPGILSLTSVGFPLRPLVLFALIVVILGLFLGRSGSIAAQLLALPFGYWYNSTLLAGTLPWQIIVPISWVAFALAAILKAPYPFGLIPAVAFVWHLNDKYGIGRSFIMTYQGYREEKQSSR